MLLCSCTYTCTLYMDVYMWWRRSYTCKCKYWWWVQRMFICSLLAPQTTGPCSTPRAWPWNTVFHWSFASVWSQSSWGPPLDTTTSCWKASRRWKRCESERKCTDLPSLVIHMSFPAWKITYGYFRRVCNTHEYNMMWFSACAEQAFNHHLSLSQKVPSLPLID